ncbi:MAG: peptidoglycan-binding protein, partial [Gallionella sp.]
LDPWKWPYIWGLNKDTIKDPHWIYPGDVVRLDRSTGTLNLGEPGTITADEPSVTADERGTETAGVRSGDSKAVRLSPRVIEGMSIHDAIPSIPVNVLAAFLSRPLAIEENGLQGAPVIVGAREGRVILGEGDVCFARGLTSEQSGHWQIYRPGQQFVDPDSKEVLGTEAIYLGDADATQFGDVSTLSITNSVQEIHAGDRLIAPAVDTPLTYLPRAPASSVSAQVISIYGGVSQAGQNMPITLNKGARDGLQIGHVLALYHKGEVIKHSGESYTLPDERYGLAFVFRVFDKVSYALVMQTKLPVQLLDRAKNP